MQHVDKAYNGQPVLQDFSLTMEAGGRYLLMAPSGAGKTTLLKIMTGLEQADRGEAEGMSDRIGMVFQEDRLCEEYDAVCNILLGMKTGGKKGAPPNGFTGMARRQQAAYVRQQAAEILPEDCLTKPVKNLSGGMRRRVALLRALLSDADVLVLDEPFTGLDEETRVRCAGFLMDNLQGRTLVMSTHREEDADLMQAARVVLGDFMGAAKAKAQI
ncbi:MAG: ATP-binding cassette domain-containing protein [Lachnospiraceae bacterium]|nr:ATP-binding cassette domain-containing protein [Lachnospiraceae bacterium]